MATPVDPPAQAGALTGRATVRLDLIDEWQVAVRELDGSVRPPRPR
jgi:hypothetical protein